MDILRDLDTYEAILTVRFFAKTQRRFWDVGRLDKRSWLVWESLWGSHAVRGCI